MISTRLLSTRPPTRRHRFRCDGCREEETFYAAPSDAGGMARRLFAGALRRKGWWASPDGRRHICPGCVRDAVRSRFGDGLGRALALDLDLHPDLHLAVAHRFLLQRAMPYPGEVLGRGPAGYYHVHYRFPPDAHFPEGGGCSGTRTAAELRRRA